MKLTWKVKNSKRGVSEILSCHHSEMIPDSFKIHDFSFDLKEPCQKLQGMHIFE